LFSLATFAVDQNVCKVFSVGLTITAASDYTERQTGKWEMGTGNWELETGQLK